MHITRFFTENNIYRYKLFNARYFRYCKQFFKQC